MSRFHIGFLLLVVVGGKPASKPDTHSEGSSNRQYFETHRFPPEKCSSTSRTDHNRVATRTPVWEPFAKPSGSVAFGS